MFSQLAKRSAMVLPISFPEAAILLVSDGDRKGPLATRLWSCQRICVLMMRITSKTIDQRSWEKTKNMAVEGGTVSHYYILVIRKFIDFMSLFRQGVWFSFSFKQFPPAEFGICNIQLSTDDKNRRRARVELSSSVLLQTLGKLKSLQGTELSVVVVICLLGSFWILTLDSRCWLIVINKVKCYEVWMFIQLWL